MARLSRPMRAHSSSSSEGLAARASSLETEAKPCISLTTSAYLALLGLRPTVQAKTSAVAASDSPQVELVIIWNISSSERSSPMHSTKSVRMPLSCMLASSRRATRPLLTPCQWQKA
uniref:Uncharacterized protein n=1 Tax=Oryza meridionalis TaxID=40149 RepID=A0A0E0CXD0_9ORYZ